MKILLINKFYYLSGGAERYLLEWERLLRSRGHDVMIFSMRHPANFPSRQERFFLDRVRFDADQPPAARLRAAAHAIWSREAEARLRAMLRSEGTPDLAHLQSFMYQLTPSVLAPLAARGVPIVQTCHDYAHVCVNQHLYNHRVNRICEECLRHGRLAPLWTRCMKGSVAASAAGCAAGCSDALFGRTRETIRRFIVPGEFMRRKLIAGGMPSPARLPCSAFHPPGLDRSLASSGRLHPLPGPPRAGKGNLDLPQSGGVPARRPLQGRRDRRAGGGGADARAGEGPPPRRGARPQGRNRTRADRARGASGCGALGVVRTVLARYP